MATEYAKAKLPLSFALGISDVGQNGVRAHNNKNTDVLGNNKGMDHLEDSSVVPALFAAGEVCGVEISYAGLGLRTRRQAASSSPGPAEGAERARWAGSGSLALL